MIIDSGNSGPLCPNSYSPQNELHRFHNDLVNTFDRSAEKNEDGEFASEEVQRIYLAVAYGVYAKMSLYRETSSITGGHYSPKGWATIESWFYKCHVCGFILPANVKAE